MSTWGTVKAGKLIKKRQAKYAREQEDDQRLLLGDEDIKAIRRKEKKYTSEYSDDIILVPKLKTR